MKNRIYIVGAGRMFLTDSYNILKEDCESNDFNQTAKKTVFSISDTLLAFMQQVSKLRRLKVVRPAETDRSWEMLSAEKILCTISAKALLTRSPVKGLINTNI